VAAETWRDQLKVDTVESRRRHPIYAFAAGVAQKEI